MEKKIVDRRTFLTTTGAFAAGTILASGVPLFGNSLAKKKVALVGTGIRASGMWTRDILARHGDKIELVGLCDINTGRVEAFKKNLNFTCPTFTDFDKMMKTTKPDMLIVTTVDGFHHEYIIRGMQLGADIITEKPLTIDEQKCQLIIDAQKATGKNIIVTFNYRFSPHRQKIWELLRNDTIGKITSVDFHWYLDIKHGASYFRRWHRLREKGGSLLVHKASHHFDLLNWWVDSEPEEVFGYGSLEFYGKNNSFRSTNCRPCPHKDQCQFYWDITKDAKMKWLYTDHEKIDGYLRDGCVFKEDINIFDKMAVQIKYKNKVQVSYSLTAYSPYEGYRISFNGTKGKLDAWIKEGQPWKEEDFDEIQVTKNFGQREIIKVPNNEGGHGGGDARLTKQIFDSDGTDPYRQSAKLRDGVMAVLVGIGARNSIDTGKPVKIESLTSLVPQVNR